MQSGATQPLQQSSATTHTSYTRLIMLVGLPIAVLTLLPWLEKMFGPSIAIFSTLLVGTKVTHGHHMYSTRFNGTLWDDANWRITTTQLDQGHYQSRMSLANGYLGINVAAAGPFFEADTPVNGDNVNGWPLFDRRQTFATVAGFWNEQKTTNGSNFDWLNQYGGESVISGVPHWSGLHLKIGDEVLDAGAPAEQISGFSSTLDIRAGTMRWSYTWAPSGGPAVDIEYEMFVHKLYVNQAAVQLKLTPSRDINASVIDLLDGDCALRTQFVEKGYEPDLPLIFSAVKPSGIEDVTAYIYSALVGDDSCDKESRTHITDESLIGANSSSIAQSLDVELKARRTSTVTKYIGGASSDAFNDPQTTALNASWSAAQQGYHELLASHVAEWKSIMTPDSVDDYRYPNGSIPDDPNILELQITAVTNPFNLLKETVGANAIAAAGNNTKLNVNSIAVGGLGSDTYGGMIFWYATAFVCTLASLLLTYNSQGQRRLDAARFGGCTPPSCKTNRTLPIRALPSSASECIDSLPVVAEREWEVFARGSSLQLDFWTTRQLHWYWALFRLRVSYQR
jgi:trehalose/maltose hydrolase-like predicted phosphorylase